MQPSSNQRVDKHPVALLQRSGPGYTGSHFQRNRQQFKRQSIAQLCCTHLIDLPAPLPRWLCIFTAHRPCAKGAGSGQQQQQHQYNLISSSKAFARSLCITFGVVLLLVKAVDDLRIHQHAVGLSAQSSRHQQRPQYSLQEPQQQLEQPRYLSLNQ